MNIVSAFMSMLYEQQLQPLSIRKCEDCKYYESCRMVADVPCDEWEPK